MPHKRFPARITASPPADAPPVPLDLATAVEANRRWPPALAAA
ncbi:hypothetical protein [Sphingomonas sp. RIT328]|nr:hypothetical protein [Sphingomonas sp. RIT328]